MLTPGSTLGGRYQLTERIASGGMGDVWKAEDGVLGRVVAVKVLLPALLEEPGFVERFRDEARTMATINHPGVVKVYDFGESDLPGGGKASFLVMEYVESEPLNQVLSRVGRLTPPRAMDLIAQGADALQAAHEKGIIHRDVKPGNLLIRPNGTLVLTDFGISRSGAGSNLTAVGSTLGTAAYMSPEQASGQVAGPLSDVYSLGIVAYQAVAGHRPFENENPLAVAMMHIRDTPPPIPADVPAPIRQFIEVSMAKDAATRWPSASAMAHAARTVGAGGPMPPPPGRPGYQSSPMPPATTRTSVMPPVVPPVIPPGNTGELRQGGYPKGTAPVPVSGPPRPQAYYPPEPPKKGKGLIVAMIAGGVVLLLLLAGIAYAVARGGANNKNKKNPVTVTTSEAVPPPAPRTSAAAVKVDIPCEELKGKQFEVADKRLRELGLKVNVNPVESDTVKEGRVVDVPCEANKGDAVTVQVSKGGNTFPTGFPTFPGGSTSPSPKPPKSPTATPTTHTNGVSQ
ncbi:putative serine/threonine-protein kinase PknA [Longispora fulva]|uniref:non-specific serine/threonine protein kinase n=1 Tax=Longispora fulva TaxID=619741 RepID=A0A8J7GL65_9ACTN|nr:serine/threonine protein kinase [Longispora fulva]MBG6139720.1 serine/threonine-protein kinase [Longispora fulva]GIG57896.1 putative serine/threonine-protein kinase PknA [Longispora fulva]